MDYIVIDGVKYADDRPKECRYCYFWENKKTGCTLGEENCYYLLKEPEEKATACTNCPYGRVHPCVGWCTKKFWNRRRRRKTVCEQDTRAFRELDRMMRQIPSYGARRPENCEACMFHQPEFKYRTCLYTRCPYGIKETVFRKKPFGEAEDDFRGRR